MGGKTNDSRLDGEGLRRLLNWSREEFVPATSDDEGRAELLLESLATRLPTPSSLEQTLPPVLRELGRRLQSVAGETLGELLRNPQAPLLRLVQLKDYAKLLGGQADAGPQAEVALAIYFAAISRALVLHGRVISRHEVSELRRRFLQLSERDWVPADLQRDFVDAAARCVAEGDDEHP